MRRQVDVEPVTVAVARQARDPADGVDVPEHEMPAEPAVGAERPLEIDDASLSRTGERRHSKRLG